MSLRALGGALIAAGALLADPVPLARDGGDRRPGPPRSRFSRHRPSLRSRSKSRARSTSRFPRRAGRPCSSPSPCAPSRRPMQSSTRCSTRGRPRGRKTSSSSANVGSAPTTSSGSGSRGRGSRARPRDGCRAPFSARTTQCTRASSSTSSVHRDALAPGTCPRALSHRRRDRRVADPTGRVLRPEQADPVRQRVLRPARVRHERHARRISRTGRTAGSSASTARTSPSCCRAVCRTDASGFGTTTSSGSAT